MKRLVPNNLTRRIAVINSEPGVVAYLDGRPYAVLTIDVADDRIKSIYIVSNPEKLAHLAPLPSPPC
jgi:RNA polymerase sigma-70 factor (ECF subfamily)